MFLYSLFCFGMLMRHTSVKDFPKIKIAQIPTFAILIVLSRRRLYHRHSRNICFLSLPCSLLTITMVKLNVFNPSCIFVLSFWDPINHHHISVHFQSHDIHQHMYWSRQCIMLICYVVFNAIFNNISVILQRSALLVEETGVHGENHRPVVSHCLTLLHNVVSSTPRHERGSNSQFQWLYNFKGSCKSNYHMVTTTMVPVKWSQVLSRCQFY